MSRERMNSKKKLRLLSGRPDGICPKGPGGRGLSPLNFRMFESVFKQKLYRTKRRISHKFESVGYRVEKTGGVFHLQALRDLEIRKIKVAIDKISDKDREQVRGFKVNGTIVKKEIWCLLPSGEFKIELIK